MAVVLQTKHVPKLESVLVFVCLFVLFVLFVLLLFFFLINLFPVIQIFWKCHFRAKSTQSLFFSRHFMPWTQQFR